MEDKEVLATLLQEAREKLQAREQKDVFKELLDALKESKITVSHIAWLEDTACYIEKGIVSEVDCTLPVVRSLLKWEEIDSYGGEGQGETWWKVYWVPDHEIHVKINGDYQSHSGVEFYGGLEDCLNRVVPREKTITVYEDA